MPSPTASGATIHAHGAALRTVRAAALPLIALSVLSAASATPPATASVDMLASLGANSARLLSALGFKSSAARRTLLAHRLRGGEMVSTRMQTPQPCSPHSSTRAERLSPLYSSEYRASELRAHKSTVTFEPPTGKAAQPLTPLSDTVAELKRQQHELTASPLKTFSSPTTLRAAPDGPGGAHELDLATPASEAGNTINRAFASLASAAATPYKLAATPARGWPKRFRAELETLKSAMSTYSASQKQAMQDLEQEKKRAAALEQQNAALEAAMRARLAEMDRVKTTMEARTRETEARLQALKGDAAAKESQDEEVSQQLQTLEKAKTALQARAARAAEDMDALRQQLGAAQAQCAQLSDEKKALHAKAAEVPPLQQHLRRVTAAKEESEQALTRMGAQHRRVLTQMQASAAEVESLKGALETQQRARVQLDKDVAALSKEKSSLIEQLRAADRSGRVAKEEGQQLVREWQKRHDSLERVLREKAAAAAGVEQQAKALRQKLEAADGKHAKSAAQLKAMTDMKQALEAQVEQLRELDARRQQENSQVKAALEMLQAEMRESQTEMTQLRADLAKALAGRDTIEQELAQLSAAHAEDRAAEAVAADAKLEALEDRRQAAAAEAAALQQQLTSLETDYAAASSLLKTAQESLAEQQREKEALAQTVRDLQQSNARLSCQGQEAEKVLQQVRGELREAKEDAAAKGAAAEAGEKRAASLEHELQRLNRHVESVEQVKRVLRHEAATTQQEMKQLRAQLAHRTHMLQVGQRSEDEKAKQLAALEEVAQTLEHKLQHAQSQAAELTQQISAGEREVEALRASLKKECDSNEVLAAELSRIQLSISAQVQASRDAANEWKLRYDGLHSDMEQAQQQLAGVRGVTRERDALVRHVSQLQDDLATMQRERAAAERTEARLQDQLRQAEALAADLRAQECAAVEAAAAAEARAEAVAGNNTALQAQLQDTEATALARQRELAEVSHKLEGLTVVKDALDRQMQVMKAEAVQLRTQLRAKEAAATSSAAELEDLRHRLGVLDGRSMSVSWHCLGGRCVGMPWRVMRSRTRARAHARAPAYEHEHAHRRAGDVGGPAAGGGSGGGANNERERPTRGPAA